jgi:phosphate uptake regulator
METRRVQKVSAGTLIVSLPKQWTLRHHIKQGTILSLRENAAGNLIVDADHVKPDLKVPHISDPEILEPAIIAAYIMGAQSVVVSNATLAIRARTLTQLQELPGLEVSEETPTSITLKCMLDMGSLRFSAILDRLCALLNYGTALVASGNRMALLQNELEINRNYHLAQRMLTRASYDNVFLRDVGIPLARLIPAYQLLVKRLEHAGDALKDLPEKNPPAIIKSIEALITIIGDMIRQHTAGKHNASLPSYERIAALGKGHVQLTFLTRTTHDIREELIMLRTGFHIYDNLM